MSLEYGLKSQINVFLIITFLGMARFGFAYEHSAAIPADPPQNATPNGPRRTNPPVTTPIDFLNQIGTSLYTLPGSGSRTHISQKQYDDRIGDETDEVRERLNAEILSCEFQIGTNNQGEPILTVKLKSSDGFSKSAEFPFPGQGKSQNQSPAIGILQSENDLRIFRASEWRAESLELHRDISSGRLNEIKYHSRDKNGRVLTDVDCGGPQRTAMFSAPIEPSVAAGRKSVASMTDNDFKPLFSNDAYDFVTSEKTSPQSVGLSRFPELAHTPLFKGQVKLLIDQAEKFAKANPKYSIEDLKKEAGYYALKANGWGDSLVVFTMPVGREIDPRDGKENWVMGNAVGRYLNTGGSDDGERGLTTDFVYTFPLKK